MDDKGKTQKVTELEATIKPYSDQGVVKKKKIGVTWCGKIIFKCGKSFGILK